MYKNFQIIIPILFTLLSIDFKVTSFTDWPAPLKINPLYAILSGFEFGDTPKVGTFYDFFSRMWDSDDNHGFLHNFFRMKRFLSDYNVTKLLLDSAHDAMPCYEYCRRQNITPFIDLNGKGGVKLPYKNDFIIGKDGVPICKEGLRMNHDGSEPAKHRIKFRCPLASRKYGYRYVYFLYPFFHFVDNIHFSKYPASSAGIITQDSERSL